MPTKVHSHSSSMNRPNLRVQPEALDVNSSTLRNSHSTGEPSSAVQKRMPQFALRRSPRKNKGQLANYPFGPNPYWYQQPADVQAAVVQQHRMLAQQQHQTLFQRENYGVNPLLAKYIGGPNVVRRKPSIDIQNNGNIVRRKPSIDIQNNNGNAVASSPPRSSTAGRLDAVTPRTRATATWLSNLKHLPASQMSFQRHRFTKNVPTTKEVVKPKVIQDYKLYTRCTFL